MGNFKLPPLLEVEDEDVYGPDDRWGVGEPIKKIITVKFGEFEVARYELMANSFGEFRYPNYEDSPEEFVANKLKKLFDLIKD